MGNWSDVSLHRMAAIERVEVRIFVYHGNLCASKRNIALGAANFALHEGKYLSRLEQPGIAAQTAFDVRYFLRGDQMPVRDIVRLQRSDFPHPSMANYRAYHDPPVSNARVYSLCPKLGATFSEQRKGCVLRGFGTSQLSSYQCRCPD